MRFQWTSWWHHKTVNIRCKCQHSGCFKHADIKSIPYWKSLVVHLQSCSQYCSLEEARWWACPPIGLISSRDTRPWGWCYTSPVAILPVEIHSDAEPNNQNWETEPSTRLSCIREIEERVLGTGGSQGALKGNKTCNSIRSDVSGDTMASCCSWWWLAKFGICLSLV